MDAGAVVSVVVVSLGAAACLGLAARLTSTRRILRGDGVEVSASVERIDPGDIPDDLWDELHPFVRYLASRRDPPSFPDVFHLLFETEIGDIVRKRFKADDGDSVVTLVYDPQNPKRAWPPENIFGRAATVQIATLWVFGALCVLLLVAVLASVWGPS
ncbi:MAG: hypothetical protein ACR2N7_09800 [Acidimicrobiia bacterium]